MKQPDSDLVPKILNAEAVNYSETARHILESVGHVDEKDLDRADLLACIPSYDALIVRLRNQIDREVIDAGGRLKAIVSATTGLDHIDVAYAHQKGIAVLSLRGQTDFLRTIPATAEHTWALLLALVRRIPWAFGSVLAMEWDRDRFKGHDLCKQRLGLLGMGRIGSIVARYARAFGMQILAYDPDPLEQPEDVIFCPTMDDLFTRSDILSIHIPLNAQTYRLIGKTELSRLPRHAILINTSRGDILDEAALLDALKTGTLAGAALDVISEERANTADARKHLLDYASTHTNLLITPHIAGATYESMASTEIFMAHQLKQFLTGTT